MALGFAANHKKKDTDMAKVASSIVGASGEYYVAAYLSSMGLVVALPRGGTPSTDLIVTTQFGGLSVSLQVKTGAGDSNHMVYKRKPENNYWMWPTSFKAIEVSNESHWFAFVHTAGWPASKCLPDVFFVPSRVVGERMQKEQKKERKFPVFWIMEGDAEQYRGLAGFRPLAEMLGV
jgi:hypothetical protein